MSTAAAPTIPPRPTRSQNQDAVDESGPKVPPRPIRNIKRDLTPERDSFARSPLHEGGFVVPPGHHVRRGSQDVPARPPSVNLPTIGSEGDEYGTIIESLSRTTSHDVPSRPHVLQSVGSDIHLYAPKPTLPPASAKAQTAAVTGVDTPGANAALNHPDEKEYLYRAVTKRSSFSSHHSATSERRRSVIADDSEQELGIPEIGMRVPMSPFAGDVQAPTAPPTGPPPMSKPTSAQGGRHHYRTASGREFYGPPGSYGLHGHGVQSQSKFERAWHDKHPEAAEHGHYAPSAVLPRSEYVLSSEDLNRVVRSTRDLVNDAGTPDEQIGYIASEEYTQRIASRASSTRPGSIKDGESQPMSPIKRLPSNISPELDDDEVIHIAPATRHSVKYEKPDDSVENLAGGDESGLQDENGYEAPILASDEIEARQGYLLPAVPPSAERRDEFESRNSSRPVSRGGSRPGSMSGGQSGPAKNLFYGYEEEHGTPLEDVEEHEPLFPEDGSESARPGVANASSAASIRSQRRKFPSKDIWEDAPDSSKLEASVDELPDEPTQDELEMERKLTKGAVDRANDFEGAEAGSFLSAHTKDFARVKGQDRPSMKQRFPSKDIWEDSPESYHLQTEVTTKEGEEQDTDPYNDVSARPIPIVPARPNKSNNVSPVDSKAAPPAISSRPKPTVPARPRQDSGDSAGAGSNLSRQTSGDSDVSESRVPPPTKPKPTSARVGGKIASLQAGFLDNLNATLGRGPSGVPKAKPAESEKKEETLSDARKGRARGPTRRPKEVKGLEEDHQTPRLVNIGGCSFMMPVTIWEVEGESGLVNVTKDKSKQKEAPGHEGKTALADDTAKDTIPDKELDTAEKAPESKSEESDYPSKLTEPGPDEETVKLAEEKEDLNVGVEAPESGMPGKADAEEKDDKLLG